MSAFRSIQLTAFYSTGGSETINLAKNPCGIDIRWSNNATSLVHEVESRSENRRLGKIFMV